MATATKAEKKAQMIDVEKATPEALMALANSKLREQREAQKEANREKVTALKEKKNCLIEQVKALDKQLAALTGVKPLSGMVKKVLEAVKMHPGTEAELASALKATSEKKLISLRKALHRLVDRELISKENDIYSATASNEED